MARWWLLGTILMWLATPGLSFASDQSGDGGLDAKAGTPAARTFGSYQEMRDAVVELFQAKKYADAAAILAGALDRYPDKVMSNSYNLALMYASMDSLQRAVRALEEGHRRGIFYAAHAFQPAPWDSLRQLESFQRLLVRNEELRAEAQKKAVMKLEVATPPGYQQGKRYPLFVALHGGGENLAQFRPQWTSPRLRQEFIVAYVQSSQVLAVNGYHWQDEEITRKEIRAAYREVVAECSVDTLRVLIGGFSSGGYGTLVSLFAEILPARGFVILCPEVPADPDSAAMARAAGRGVRGTLLSTELDGRLARQKEYAANLTAHGIDVEVAVTPNVGHWYPDDFERLLDEALARIWPVP